jgi:hypothetical protein
MGALVTFFKYRIELSSSDSRLAMQSESNLKRQLSGASSHAVKADPTLRCQGSANRLIKSHYANHNPELARLMQQRFKEQMQAIAKIAQTQVTAQVAGGMPPAMPSNGAPQGNMQPMPVG